MNINHIQLLLREGLLSLENKDNSPDKGRNLEQDVNPEDEHLPDDEYAKFQATVKPWKQNWARIIDHMDIEGWTSGDDATQRSLFRRKLLKIGGEKFTKREVSAIFSSMEKNGMGKRTVS